MSRGGSRIRAAARYAVPASVLAAAAAIAVFALPARPAGRESEIVAAALLGEPNLRLVFREPVEVAGMYGLRRTVREIRLRVDEPDRLVAAIPDSIEPR